MWSIMDACSGNVADAVDIVAQATAADDCSQPVLGRSGNLEAGATNRRAEQITAR